MVAKKPTPKKITPKTTTKPTEMKACDCKNGHACECKCGLSCRCGCLKKAIIAIIVIVISTVFITLSLCDSNKRKHPKGQRNNPQYECQKGKDCTDCPSRNEQRKRGPRKGETTKPTPTEQPTTK